MPNLKRALSLAVSRSNEAVKPQPPADLWQQMDEICAELNMNKCVVRGPGMFTSREYADRYSISVSAASVRLRKLIKLGKVEFIGGDSHGQRYFRLKA